MTERPEPFGLGFAHEALHDVTPTGADLVGLELCLDRVDLLLDEAQHPVSQRRHVLRNGKAQHGFRIHESLLDLYLFTSPFRLS